MPNTIQASFPSTSEKQHFEDLLTLVDVYTTLPRRALVITLEERGAGHLQLNMLSDVYLVALAVHTHRIGWNALPQVRHFRREGHPSQKHGGPLTVDVPV